MTYEQKMAALNALAECAVKMRKPGDWYVEQSTEVTADGRSVLEGRYGDGTSPQDAIENHWKVLVTDLGPTEYIVIHSRDEQRRRRHLTWNGFMWEDA